MKSYIETTCPDDHTIIVNKIMQPWVGPQWLQDSTINSASG
ncbi:hypothetical protein PR002_g28517 [Phytophthora rubi]|uniref:Uncharacterized protein n=1 Tax=Phytophthora rubi TaxID=129364 RepID=A0A6A3H9V8_9STRA|nr:hypothetical protein PR002_g28517 [Phytophthora rubi]